MEYLKVLLFTFFNYNENSVNKARNARILAAIIRWENIFWYLSYGNKSAKKINKFFKKSNLIIFRIFFFFKLNCFWIGKQLSWFKWENLKILKVKCKKQLFTKVTVDVLLKNDDKLLILVRYSLPKLTVDPFCDFRF